MTNPEVLTLEEVKKHDKADDLWVIIHDKVYNLTEFAEEHPGGARVIAEQAGGYASEPFEDVGHSQEARKLMEEYCIGELCEYMGHARRRSEDHVKESMPRRLGHAADKKTQNTLGVKVVRVRGIITSFKVKNRGTVVLVDVVALRLINSRV